MTDHIEAIARALYRAIVQREIAQDGADGRHLPASEWHELEEFEQKEFVEYARPAWAAAQPKVEEMVREGIENALTTAALDGFANTSVGNEVSRVMEGGQ